MRELPNNRNNNRNNNTMTQDKVSLTKKEIERILDCAWEDSMEEEEMESINLNGKTITFEHNGLGGYYVDGKANGVDLIAHENGYYEIPLCFSLFQASDIILDGNESIEVDADSNLLEYLSEMETEMETEMEPEESVQLQDNQTEMELH